MRVSGRTRPLVLVVALLAIVACQKESTEEPQGGIQANRAYIRAFGQPPVPARGEAFARVGYYPLRSEPDKLQALPFFLYNQTSELPLLLKRLVQTPFDFPAAGLLLNPFPPGCTLRVGPRAATVQLDLIVPGAPPPGQLAAMASAVTETAAQFSDIEMVRLRMNGAVWPAMPTDGFRSRPERIVAPGPPQLYMVVGNWEPDAVVPGEVLVNFDRPVSIERFNLMDEAGQGLEGDYFTSVFDMVVVLHPRYPETLREGALLRVEWQAIDRLGRKGAGAEVLRLQRHDHAEEH
jgi:hypothetical protein